MRRTRRPHLPIACIALMVSAAVMHAATTTIGATPSTATLSYSKGAVTLPTARVAIAPVGTTSSIYFTINPQSLPSWVQVDKTNGTCTTAAPVTLTFSPSLVAANSPAGTYSALVEIDSAGLAPINVTVNMTVTNATPTVTATLAISPSANWTPGTTPPTGVLTVKSSGDPVYFSVSATPSWITLGATSAVAYSWGTNVAITFAQSAFDSPTVNSTLTGSITVKAGSVTLAPNLVSITIGQPVATITSISPKQLPQSILPATAVRTIAVQGTGFAIGMNVMLGGAAGKAVPYNCATFSAVPTSGPSTDAWCLQSGDQFFLRLSSGTLSGASATGNQLILYLSADPNGQIPIPVVTTPIVYAVTDAASFIQPAPKQYLNVAPYEMLSIFGDNFGTPSAPMAFSGGRLPSSLTDASANPLKVDFTDASGNDLRADSDASLLLWTSTQINLLAPSTLPGSAGGQELKATVWAGGASSLPGPATTFNVVQASPGLLTFGGGQGVVVNAVDNSVNSSTNPARFGGTIVLYVSGMGDPEGGSSFAGNAGPLLPGFAGCATPASFVATANLLNGTNWTTADGAIMSSAVLGPYATAPCFDPSTVSVKFGNLTLTTAVTYAGFTQDSIAGLYQVNVALPLSSSATLAGLAPPAASTPTAYPIQVSIGGGTSQAGVNVYVAK